MGVRKFTNGDIEVDFYHENEITEYRLSSDSSRLSNFPQILIETLASTLATNICIEIYFGKDGNPTHVELENVMMMKMILMTLKFLNNPYFQKYTNPYEFKNHLILNKFILRSDDV